MPFSPNRQQMVMFGSAAGLALGLVVVFLLEYRDRSMKTDEDIAAVLSLPVLAVVPFMRSRRETRRRRSRQVTVHFALSIFASGCLVVLAYTLLR